MRRFRSVFFSTGVGFIFLFSFVCSSSIKNKAHHTMCTMNNKRPGQQNQNKK